MMIGKSVRLADYEADAALQSAARMPVPVSGTVQLGTGLIAAMTGLVRTIGERRRHKLAMRELYALDDRMLRDIGVDRSAVPRAARYGRELR